MYLFSKPITLAILGLNEFSSDISEEQKKWCLETIFNPYHLFFKIHSVGTYEFSKGSI